MLPSSPTVGLLVALLPLVNLAKAACECGYTQDAGTIWTDALETDFTTLKDISADWAVQTWTSPLNASEAPYGRVRESRNVVANPAVSSNNGAGRDGGQAGLELIVRPVPGGQMLVPVGEIYSKRADIRYGTFRAGIKFSGVNGTCGAFFWYLNATQEIDVEYLSSQATANSSAVNFVLQSPESFAQGSDASRTPAFKNLQLPFVADDAIHEYRYDWTPDSITFFIDAQPFLTLSTSATGASYVPNPPSSSPGSGGYIVLNHWSNGNAGWSRGPPAKEAIMTVSYVKAYFNSSDVSRVDKFEKGCKSREGICGIAAAMGWGRAVRDYRSGSGGSGSSGTQGTKSSEAASVGVGAGRREALWWWMFGCLVVVVTLTM